MSNRSQQQCRLPYQTLLDCPKSQTSQCIADYLNTPMNSPTMAMAMMGERLRAEEARVLPFPLGLAVPTAAPQHFTAFRPQRFFKLS